MVSFDASNLVELRRGQTRVELHRQRYQKLAAFRRCLARMALYAWGQSASSLAARGRFLLYFRELWQLMMTSKTCLG